MVPATLGVMQRAAAAAAAGPYLALDAVDLVVLRVDLVAHVQGHALQVPHDAPDVSQVLLHLVLAGVVGHPAAGAQGRRTRVMVYDNSKFRFFIL